MIPPRHYRCNDSLLDVILLTMKRGNLRLRAHVLSLWASDASLSSGRWCDATASSRFRAPVILSDPVLKPRSEGSATSMRHGRRSRDSSSLRLTRAQGTVVASAAKDSSVGVTAVSYTHLRAHEPALDLVCRLLLEKKSNPFLSLIFLPSQSKPFFSNSFANPHP